MVLSAFGLSIYVTNLSIIEFLPLKEVISLPIGDNITSAPSNPHVPFLGSSALFFEPIIGITRGIVKGLNLFFTPFNLISSVHDTPPFYHIPWT